MKYGIIVNINTDNIGDDVQSYAAEKLLPHLDAIVSRENMDEFYPPEEKYVSIFMNGWFMYNPLSWPPSPYLNVLPIAFHITPDIGQDIRFMWEGEGGEWLKAHAPIGCRDISTKTILENNGIPAYFSGCLTLTIEPLKNCEYHGKVVLSDLPPEIVHFVMTRTKKETFYLSHTVNLTVKHSWDMRRNLTEQLLKIYQGASLVVTSRLHSALPCLALGTPVLLVSSMLDNARIQTYLPFLHHTTPQDLLNGNFTYDFNLPVKNPSKHIEIAQSLRRRCKEFIDECEKNPFKEPRVDYEETVKRIRRLKSIAFHR